MIISLSDNDTFNAEDVRDLGDGIGVMADAQRIVVGRALHDPLLEELADIGLEEAARVRVASPMTNFILPSYVWVIPSMVMGPSLILNSTDAPCPGLPWYFFRLRSTGFPSALAR